MRRHNSLFCRLFETQPEIHDIFENFRHLKTAEEQKNSVELEEHATMVMSTIDEAINIMNDADAFLSLVTRIGASHTRIKGFKVEYFSVRCSLTLGSVGAIGFSAGDVL